MSSKSSSLVKCVFVCGVLLLFAVLLIKRRPDESINLQASDQSNRMAVPLERLLDLPTKFRFLLKPKNVCDKTKHLLIFVHSRVDNFEARQTIRSTWGSLQRSLNYRLVFLIGLQERKNEGIEQLLKDEQNLNDDLVRGNFIDTYRNLTYKHVCGMKFVLHHCSNARFIMKTDDDAFINIFEVLDLFGIANFSHGLPQQTTVHDKTTQTFDFLDLRKGYGEIKLLNAIQTTGAEKRSIYKNQQRSLANHRRMIQSLSERNLKFMACSLFPFGTETRRAGKWSLTKEEYGPDHLPSYCSGIAYFLNSPALLSIYTAAHQMKRPFFIDDLYLTGIVVQQVLRQTNYPNYSNYLNDSNNDYSSSDTDFSSTQMEARAKHSAEKLRLNSATRNAKRLVHHSAATPHSSSSISAGQSDFQILDWSELYNYRWPQFIKALAQPDNSFNSVFLINDLDRMPNRKELVQIAWKKIKNYYQYSVT